MSYARTVLKGTAIGLIVMVCTAALAYIFRLLLARNLSLEEFGLFFAVFAFVNLFYGFRGFGTGPAFVRFISEFRAKNDLEGIKRVIISFLIIQLVTMGILSIIILAFAPYLAENYFKTDQAFPILVILTIAFLFSVFMSVFRGLFLGYQKILHYSATDFLQILLVVVFSALFLFLGQSLLAPAWAYLIAFFGTSVISLLIALRTFPLFKVKTRLNRATFGKLIKFGLTITVGMMASSFVSGIGIVLLTYFRSLPEVALYAVALPTANLLRYIPKAVSTIILPVSAELYFKNNPDFGKGLTRLYRYLFIVIVPLALIMVAFPEEIITLAFGAKFDDAAIALQILALGMIFAALYLVNQNILLGTDKPKSYTHVLIIGGIISVVLNLILIPLLGIAGAALANSISFLIMFILSSVKIKKYVKHVIPWAALTKTLFAGFVFVGLSVWLKNLLELNVYIETAIVAGFGLALYAIIILLLRVVTLSEIKSLIKLT